MTVKRVPLLKCKETHEVDADSLTAALYWDKVAAESLRDDDIPYASDEGIAENAAPKGLEKAQDLEKLVKRQAKEKALPPPEEDDDIWEVDEAYLDELASRVEAGVTTQKGGPRSGWFAPPKGTHGKGKIPPKLSSRLERIKRAVPAKHLKGLKIEISEDLEIGRGSYGRGKLVLHPQKAQGITIAHEIGHHVYSTIASDKLKAASYSAWQRAMEMHPSELKKLRFDPDRTPQGRTEFFADVYTLATFSRLNKDRGMWKPFSEHPEFISFAKEFEKELYKGELFGKEEAEGV